MEQNLREEEREINKVSSFDEESHVEMKWSIMMVLRFNNAVEYQ